MRITRNGNNTVCGICGEPMRKGELGTNYAPAVEFIVRAHVNCAQKRIDKYRKEYELKRTER